MKLRLAVAAAWKWFFGAVLCTGPVGGVLVAGWTLRAARRAVLHRWWKAAGGVATGRSFAEFVEADDSTRACARWPHWFLAQTPPAPGGGVAAFVRRLTGSFGANLKLGIQGLFNTAVLTLPACVLWLFAWYDGWNNSFHKGYEQWWVAVSTGLLGSALFVAAMLYVPMAQVRQASTGDWRSFYQFGLVWGLVRRSWFSNMALAALYSATMVPFMVAWILPRFFPALMPESGGWTDAQVLEFLNGYYFWCCAALFPTYVVLRLAAAKIYAAATLAAVQSGDLPPDALAAPERAALDRLGLAAVRAPAPHHPVVRAALWTTTRAGRLACAGLAVAFWVSFVAQTFVAQFFQYRGRAGWLNQTLVQVPWFRFVPERLEEG